MSQRNPARAISNRGGSTIRYDLVWTLPFSEYARIGTTEQQTWWIDSIHGNETQARKRYYAIADAVAAGNGSVALLEIMADPRNPTFSQRVVNRAGNVVAPPHISKIDPVALEVAEAFKDFVARYQARNKSRLPVDVPVRPSAKNRRKSSNYGAWAACLVGFFAVLGIIAVASIYRTPGSQAGGINGFGARTFGTAEAAPLVSHERPTQMIYVPSRGENGERLCEVSRIEGRQTVYLGKGACPNR